MDVELDRDGGGCLPERSLFDELLGLEIASQVEDLPDGEAEKTAHAEDAEVEDFGVGGLWSKQNESLRNGLDERWSCLSASRSTYRSCFSSPLLGPSCRQSR